MLELCDGLRIERAPVVANSMGGLFTHTFAAVTLDALGNGVRSNA